MISVKGKQFSVGAFTFARGGSKGITKKNLAPLDGKPLIEYSIVAAQNNNYIDEVYVSTDDTGIANIASELGACVPFLRPKELSKDDTPEFLAWQHALKFLKDKDELPNIFISLPATAPLRSNKDISKSIETLINSDADISISVAKSDRNPYFNMVTIDQNGYAKIVINPSKPITRRQDAPSVYDISTVAYSSWPDYILNNTTVFDGKVITVEVPKERALDIDTPLDLMLAEFLLQKRKSVAEVKF